MLRDGRSKWHATWNLGSLAVADYGQLIAFVLNPHVITQIRKVEQGRRSSQLMLSLRSLPSVKGRASLW
jgi:hypothetical protein